VAGETGPAINPIEQFSITPLIPIRIAGHDFSLTNSSLYMLIAVGLACLLMTAGARGGPGIPGRLQSLAELAYEFIAGMLRSASGEKGMRFFPMVFCLFMFILICNLVGLLPYSFTVTSHIIVTATMALLVFLTVIVVGIYEHGFGFFKLFVPSGVPIYILPLVVAIEVISFFTRPLSHSVRLFANMLAGHITLNVFGGFVVMLLGAGAAVKALAVLPFAMTIGLDALELLVAFLQAYVFAMLTCMYLNDAIHPGGH
jgi:F-type H+-transporting ATPase subunit a